MAPADNRRRIPLGRGKLLYRTAINAALMSVMGQEKRQGGIRIFVDGDACPVKAETLKVAERHGLPVVIVSNGGLRPSRDPMVRHVVVARNADAADDWILAEIARGEIAITADIPLAARLVEKGAHVIGPNGKPFSPDSIGMAVAMRDLKQHLRETGAIAGHNPEFTRIDRSRFLGTLDRLVRQTLRDRPGGSG